ncbi:MAG TPA: cysteine peptidase family C39 domain-containing protein [Acidimicrobiales bacterium]|nr:cysteine peptidase family C39 domain-containing protein [Acidimicrobiales bacterium]
MATQSSPSTAADDARTHKAVRTPTVLQMEITECGAASLTMILNTLGRDVLLEEAREACAVSRDGVNALKIVQAARSFGLDGGGYRRSVDQLRALAPPFIVFWNQNHFLVVEGFGRRKVHLNDPASGRRAVSYEEFEESYSGIVLKFSPGEGFRRDPQRRRRRPLVDLLGQLARSRRGIVYAVIAGLALVVPTTAAAILTSIFVTQVLTLQNRNWVTKVVLVAALVALLLFSLNLFEQRVLLRLQTKLSIRMSAGFLWHLLRLPTQFFDARSPGGLVSRVQLNAQVAQLLSGQLATASISLVTMVLFAVVLVILNWILALVALGLAAVNVVVLLSVSRVRIAVNQNLQQTLVRLSGYTYLGINLIDDIKATGSENDFFSRWAGSQARALNAEQRLGFLTQTLLVVPGFLSMLNTVVVLAVGGYLVIDGTLGLSGLIAFQVLAGSFFAPIAQLISVASQFQNARAWMQQIGDVMRQPIDPSAVDVSPALATAAGERAVARPGRSRPGRRAVRSGGVMTDGAGTGDSGDQDGRTLEPSATVTAAPKRTEARLRGQVELRHVTFGYVSNEPPLIRDFSLTVQPGERVALVGPTGSGKTTVANLLVGLFHPWEGEILFDGLPREGIPREVMAASLGKVDQSIMLFSGTVADNIRFWDRSIPALEVVRAAEDACVAEEIEAKPGGYAHHVAEGGRNFSGGQRQRLEFARALATNPTVLILDEATSALDTVTEQRLDINLRRRGCSCLLVAHRLSTIRDCDQIVVLDQGDVVERGTHEQLISLGGLYQGLVSDG